MFTYKNHFLTVKHIDYRAKFVPKILIFACSKTFEGHYEKQTLFYTNCLHFDNVLTRSVSTYLEPLLFNPVFREVANISCKNM